MHSPRPLALIILDGWGYREETSANAIAAAHKPNWNFLLANHTHTLISGSGKCVGLPAGQMGNSEVGHLNMGAGRVVYQELTRIDAAIQQGDFFSNPVLVNAFQIAEKKNKAVHILGLLSPGGVHSHEKHIAAILKFASLYQVSHVYLHAFLDGRDTPPKSSEASIHYILEETKNLPNVKIASLIGRYYAMDRDKRWDRVQKAYDLLVNGDASFHAKDAISGLQAAYARSETDEFVQATAIHALNEPAITIQEDDVVIFMNFRADRARELSHALMDESFDGFTRTHRPKLSEFITLTEYDVTLKASIAYAPERLNNILGAYISEKGFTQLRIAETEKYAHVTFFFNGGIERPFPGEDRILVPSPKVTTYDLKPEMSAYEMTDQLIDAIRKEQYDVIICNFANPDMVGHTGNLPATIEAIETIDVCIGKIISALQAVGGEALITSDHGNAEMLFDDSTGQAHTAHTSELVPFVYFGRKAKIAKSNGILSDIAPTMLYLMGLPKPNEMTGTSLLELL